MAYSVDETSAQCLPFKSSYKAERSRRTYLAHLLAKRIQDDEIGS